jgi:hypothetical protein
VTKRPGKLTIRNADGHATLVTTPMGTSARHVVLTIGTTHTALDSPAAVEGLAKHLTQCAAWMRAGSVTPAQVADQFDDVMRRFRDLAMRGSA